MPRCQQLSALRKKQKKNILNRLRLEVTAFLEEHPEADMVAIRERFGTPQAVASAYVESMDTAQLLKDLRIRKRILTAVMAAVIFVLITWAGVITWAIQYEINSSTVEITDTIVVHD